MLNRLTWIAAAMAGLVLAGCNTESTLQPQSGLAGSAAGNQAQLGGGNPPLERIESNARIRVAPIVGTTVEAATPLTRRLSLRAAERGLKLLTSDETGATHILKGYFSAFSESGTTTVVFVWDVLDPAGNRLHRIQGQETIPAAAAGEDAWSVVPPEGMERIADRSIDSLATWFAGATG